jgi:predicted dehydrogenase
VSVTLNIGVIGGSQGNGHPYSWSAIFNGYNATSMEKCGFPVIPRYLEEHSFPDDAIHGASVTHVWTQDLNLSKHIAKAAHIKNVVKNMNDLIGSVDAVLLARDDAERHLEMALPFLDAGIPIYIDKPLALTTAEAYHLIELQQYPGQIFSCSALRYAQELNIKEYKSKIGKLRSIHAIVPKDWDKYAIHAIDPLLLMIPDRGNIVKKMRWAAADRVVLNVEFESGVDIQISSMGKVDVPISFRIFGSEGWCDIVFSDTFSAFRGALQEFVYSITNKESKINSKEMIDAIELLEMGKI